MATTTMRSLVRSRWLNSTSTIYTSTSTSTSTSTFLSTVPLRAPLMAVSTPAPRLFGSSADPASVHYKYWNREAYQKKGKDRQYDYILRISPESIVREGRVVSLSDPHDSANDSLHTSLPIGSKLVATGTSLEDIEVELHSSSTTSTSTSTSTPQPNVLFVSPSCPVARVELPRVLEAYPSIDWVHVRSAGIDFVVSEKLSRLVEQRNAEHLQNMNINSNGNGNGNGAGGLRVTNAKGQFSSSLAEYAMMACSYFAKDLPRLLKQQSSQSWQKYDVEELRGKTMGIVGYGDIGRACAKLAHVYGMKIVALRRNPELSRRDPLCEVVYGTDKASLNLLLRESDYVVCSTPSTVETRGMMNAASFAAIKPGAVFINLGRGPVVDEEALVQALQNGTLKGAALDVFIEEPLPAHHPLWTLPNVLLSPHNMDQTQTFMHEATEFFVYENLPRYMCGQDLLNPVDTVLGY